MRDIVTALVVIACAAGALYLITNGHGAYAPLMAGMLFIYFFFRD